MTALWLAHTDVTISTDDRCDDCQILQTNPDRYGYSGAIIRDAQAGGYAGLTRAARHPVIVTHQDNTRTHVVALTSKPATKNGTCRPQVPDHHAVGLNGPSFIYRPRTVRLSALDLDLDLEIGQADSALVELLIDTVPLPGDVQRALRASVCQHDLVEVV